MVKNFSGIGRILLVLSVLNGVFSFSILAADSANLLQATINKHTLRHYFPQADVNQADRINCVMLKPKYRPPSWTDRIPFGVAIDSQRNTAYYLLYESFFSKKIMPFPNMDFKKLADISAYADGQIALADVDGDQIQFFQFKYPTLSSTAFVKVLAPRRVEFDYSGRLWCIGKNGISVFQPGKDNLEPMKPQADLINTVLIGQKLQDLSITRQGFVDVLTDRALYQFASDGRFVASTNVQANYCAIETSAYGEIYALRSTEKAYDVYAGDLTFMNSVDIRSEFTEQPRDITIYDNFGYIIINALHQGAYYGMGVSILDPKLLALGNPDDGYHIQFSLTMPAYIWVTITGETPDNRREIVENVLQKAGSQSIFWDGKINGVPVNSATISIRATAAYSLGNSTKTEFKMSAH